MIPVRMLPALAVTLLAFFRAFLRGREESKVSRRRATGGLLPVAPGVGKDLMQLWKGLRRARLQVAARGGRRRRRAGKRQPGAQTSARSNTVAEGLNCAGTAAARCRARRRRSCTASTPNLPPTSRPTTTRCRSAPRLQSSKFAFCPHGNGSARGATGPLRGRRKACGRVRAPRRCRRRPGTRG